MDRRAWAVLLIALLPLLPLLSSSPTATTDLRARTRAMPRVAREAPSRATDPPGWRRTPEAHEIDNRDYLRDRDQHPWKLLLPEARRLSDWRAPARWIAWHWPPGGRRTPAPP